MWFIGQFSLIHSFSSTTLGCGLFFDFWEFHFELDFLFFIFLVFSLWSEFLLFWMFCLMGGGKVWIFRMLSWWVWSNFFCEMFSSFFFYSEMFSNYGSDVWFFWGGKEDGSPYLILMFARGFKLFKNLVLKISVYFPNWLLIKKNMIGFD